TMALRLTDSTYREFRLDRWDQIRVRQRWVDYGNDLLEVFLREYRWVEVALDRDIIDEARQLMVSCNLSSYDAAHVATALSLGITDLAAVDSHFEHAGHLLTVHTIRSTPAVS
ncbi:MAG TPA: PIN domain-containing protein, partial [Thermomicrobiales bacterium]|nr:PIN domain-containing protein [Thermomicrobiales bacterium]